MFAIKSQDPQVAFSIDSELVSPYERSWIFARATSSSEARMKDVMWVFVIPGEGKIACAF